MPVARESAAAPKPSPLGDSWTTEQAASSPAEVAAHFIFTAPEMPAWAA
ncbi:MAG TPA: hypothetical protein VGI95_04215 [Caulobacteraceae bacterium]